MILALLTTERTKNVVISGLRPSEPNDTDTVERFIQTEFGQTAGGVVKCRRLGRQLPSKIQPLLVTLESDKGAQFLIQSAKRLRQSSDDYTRKSVFINPDVTKAEAFAAYQARCERRQRAAKTTSSTTPVGPSTGHHTTTRPASAAAAPVATSSSSSTSTDTSSPSPPPSLPPPAATAVSGQSD